MLEALGTKIEKEQLLHKYKNHELYTVPIEEWTPLTKKLLKALPYSLTPSQLNAVSEIIFDLKRPVPMNKLLQGDVGCGKTAVAFLACMEVIGSGFQIMDLPPGRTPIKTFVLEGNEAGFENVFKMMQDELMGGGKVYLVYPVIEESEQLPQLRAGTAEFKTISEKFKNYQCGLLHGRMKSEEKDEALKKFRSGGSKILLATQVIEIGVDVADASMMVVMNAERFGIAQLHQLRGRVGRGERKSKCVFLSSTSGTLNRLKVLEKSSDAFYLANADLLRGPGNLLGKKQSGHLPEFPIARLEIDGNILQEAHLAALKVLVTSNDLEKFPRLKAELSMRQPLCLLGD